MTCSVDFKNSLRNNIKTLTDTINSGIEYNYKGIHVKTLRDKLHQAYKAVSEGKDPSGDLTKIKERENNLLYTTTRNQLKEFFKAGFGKGDRKSYFLEDVVQGEPLENRETLQVKVRPVIEGKVSDRVYTYTFAEGSDTSIKTPGGRRFTIPNFSTIMEKAIRDRDVLLFEADKEENLNIGNANLKKLKMGIGIGSGKGRFNYKGAKHKAEYTHGDIDSMIRIADELAAMDPENTPEGYADYVKGLFGRMNQSFFYDMDLYIKEGKSDARGFMDIENKNIVIKTGKDKTGGKSNLEVYAHEIIHSMTYWALRSGTATADRLRRQLDYMFKQALRATTWKDLLDVKENEEPSELDIKRAKDMHEYLFSGDNARDEFLAHAVTNPLLMKHLEKLKLKGTEEKPRSLAERIGNFFASIVDLLLGKYNFSDRNNNVQQQVAALSLRLAEINTKAESKVSELNLVGKLNNYIDTTDDKWRDWMTKFQEKHFDKTDKFVPLDKDAGFLETMWFTTKFVAKASVNKNYRIHLGLAMSAWADAGIPTKAGGTIREFMSSFFKPSEHFRIGEMLSLHSEHLDTIRGTVINETAKTLMESFKKKPNEAMSKAITRALIDTNMSTLFYNDTKAPLKRVYDSRLMREVLVDQEMRNKKRAHAESRLRTLLKDEKTEGRANWTIAQARGLGFFMATHEGSVNQNTSARNIAKGYLLNTRFKYDPNVVALVEEISVLTALEYTSRDDNLLLATMMKEEPKGIQKVMDTYEAFKRDSRSKLFKSDEAHMMDGYSKELLDDSKIREIRPMSEREELEKAGYVFHGLLEPKNGEIRTVELGVFISDSYSRPEKFRGGVFLESNDARGTDLREIKEIEGTGMAGMAFARDMARINKEAAALSLKQVKGERVDFSKVATGMVPIVDSTGRVVSYRYMMSKKQKEKLLGQDLNGLEVLSRSMGSIVYKEMRDEHNKKALEGVKQIMKENWEEGRLGKDNTEFTLIGPKVDDPKMVELYYMLPREFKQFINSRQDKTMAIPSTMMPIMFGQPHMMLTEKVKKYLPRSVTRIVDMFESFYIDLVKIAKGNILLKMPWILVSNIVSNAIYLLTTTGMGPVELVKAHAESFRSAKAYMKNYRDKNRLLAEIGQLESGLKSKAKDKESMNLELRNKRYELNKVNKEMEESSIHELFTTGLFQSVVEDVNVGILGDTNKVTAGMDKILSKTPGFIKTPLQIAYLSKETQWYKVNQEILQLSDLIARDIKNKKMKWLEGKMANGERLIPRDIKKALGIKEEGLVTLTGDKLQKFREVSAKGRIETLLDEFINYNKPNGRFEEYLNRLGLLMFTKYVKRIQRVIASMALNHPIKSTLGVMLAVFALDLDNISNQAFLYKGFGFDGSFSPTNIFPVYNPTDIFWNVVTPAVVKLVPY